MRDVSPLPGSRFTFPGYIESVKDVTRFLFFAHDGLGLGHVRRNLSLARAVTDFDPGASVLVVTNAGEVESLGVPPRVGVLKLPSLSGDDGGSESPKLAGAGVGRPLQASSPFDLRVLRERVLAATAETFRPDVVLVDRHPLGVGGELGPALEIARAAGARAVLGLLDVLDERSAVDVDWRARGVFARVSEHFDRVLVYGQPDVLDPVRDHGFRADLAAITSFCGYVVAREYGDPQHVAADEAAPPVTRTSSKPHVLATAGGGEVGFELLATFADAAADANWRATVVAGAQCPPERAAWLRAFAAEHGIAFRVFVPNLPAEFPSLDALVCLGGYNTLAEAAASRVPTVCVPLLESRDQLLRARAFAARRLIRLVEPDGLTPDVLRGEVDAALASTRGPDRARALDLGGGRRAAFHLLELAAQRSARPVAAGFLAG